MKRIIKRFNRCKKSITSYYLKPLQELITLTKRAKQDLSFSVIGTYFAGPFICKEKYQNLLLVTCSANKPVHLQILPNQTTQEFM